MDETLVRRALGRALEQYGNKPSEYRLPEEKTSYPKLICLDMNKWVDLGKAYYGQPGGQEFEPALSAVRIAMASGKAVIPITSVNLDEASESTDPQRRERFARFIVDLSANHSMLNHETILEGELYRAIQKIFLKQTQTLQLRHRLVGRGIHTAQGRKYGVSTGDPMLNEVVGEALKDPEFAVDGIVHAVDRDTERMAWALDRKAAQVIDGIRKIDADKTMAERHRLELYNFFKSGTTATMLTRVLTEHLLVDPADFYRWLATDDNVELFGAELSSIHVQLTLMLHRDRNPQCPVRPNDLKDLTFLGIVVPYANIVVTENQWAHFIRSSGLGTKYGTRVLTRTDDLPGVLTEEGCLE